MNQFKGDVLYSEEMAINKWILMEILVLRNMVDRKNCTEQLEDLQRQLDKERDKQKTTVMLLQWRVSGNLWQLYVLI